MSVSLKFRPVKRKFTTKMVSDKIQNLTGKINTLNNGLQRGVCVDPKIDPVRHLFQYVEEYINKILFLPFRLEKPQ